MPLKKLGYARVGNQAVLELDNPVALVLEAQILDPSSLGPHPLRDLLCLRSRHAWIVGAVDNHQRRRDAIRLVERREPLEQLAVLIERAVLGLTQPAPPGSGSF